MDRWPLESCLEILAYCISDPAVQDGLERELQRKLVELRVYQKVGALASNFFSIIVSIMVLLAIFRTFLGLFYLLG